MEAPDSEPLDVLVLVLDVLELVSVDSLLLACVLPPLVDASATMGSISGPHATQHATIPITNL